MEETTPRPSAETYEFSGRLGDWGWMALGLGVLWAFIVAFPYSFFLLGESKPISEPSFLDELFFVSTTVFPLILACTVGWSVSQAVALGGHLGHCRSPSFLKGSAAFAGFVLFYTSWVTLVWRLEPPPAEASQVSAILGLFFSPQELWETAKQIAETGKHIPGRTRAVTGGWVWLIWLGEAIILIYWPTVSATSRLHDNVYSEEAGRWLPRWKPILSLRPKGDDLETISQAFSGDLSLLESLEVADGEEVPRLDVIVWAQSGISTAVYQHRLTVTLNENAKAQKIAGAKFLADEAGLSRLRALRSRQASGASHR